MDDEFTIVEVKETPIRSPGDEYQHGSAQIENEDVQEEIEEAAGPWHETDLGKRYKNLLESGCMSDITINVGNSTFQCHKIIVGASSPKIAKMVRNKKSVQLKNIEPNHFRFLLEIIYVGKAENLDNVEDVLAVGRASHKSKVYSGVAYCRELLRAKIRPESACEILEFAVLTSDDDLKELCIEVIQEQTHAVLANKAFINCNHATLELILSQKELHGVTELDLFLACAHWAELRQQPRQALGSALRLIRFRLLTSKDFAEKVMPSNLLTVEEEKCLTRYFLIGKGETALLVRQEGRNSAWTDYSVAPSPPHTWVMQLIM